MLVSRAIELEKFYLSSENIEPKKQNNFVGQD
jgi:hypothetical protein